MKLELNFMEDRDGNPCVVISSPSVEKGIIQEIYCEHYESILDILSNPEATEKDLKGVISIIAAELSDENPEEHLSLSVWKHKLENGAKHCGMLACINDEWGGIQSGTTTDISNKDYKKFCKGSTMQRINIAYNAFKDEIESGIFNH